MKYIKKERPEGGASERQPMHVVHENDIVILDDSTKIVKMPVYSMPDETPERWNAMVARIDREAEMERMFWEETNDPETWAWREDLTDEEAELVAAWDEQSAMALSQLCKEILNRA